MADNYSDTYDSKHFQRGEYNVRRINILYRNLINQIIRLQALGRIDTSKLFSFSDYPDLEKSVNRLFEQFTKNVTTELFTQVEQSWKYAEKKQADFVGEIASKLNLSKEKVKEYTNPNKDALNAFKNRKENGLNLSNRVWKLTDQFRNEIELGLDLGIGEGKSAAKLARELRSNLNDPDRLFRRVRDKHGNLILSKAAKSYHPGQGVYRSSVKNAQRLTRTENNIAYHEANYLKYQQFDFVVGIQIKLSNNPNHCPFCESMAGNYPKDFKFLGWHPQCRCTTITVLKTWKEMERDNERIWNGEEPLGSINEVSSTPKAFVNWVQENSDKINSSKNKPYFIKNNPIRTNVYLLMKKASDSSGELGNILSDLNAKLGGYSTPVNLKSESSMMRKVNHELGGDVNQVKDSVRATVILPEESMLKIVEYLEKSGIFERIKVQTPDSFAGYSGILTNLKTKNGIFAEVQFNTDKMIYAKEKPADAIRIMGKKRWDQIKRETGLEGGLGHKYYEEMRVLDKTDPKRLIIEKQSIEYYKNFR